MRFSATLQVRQQSGLGEDDAKGEFGGLPAPPAGGGGVLVMTQGLGAVHWVVRSLLRQRYKVSLHMLK